MSDLSSAPAPAAMSGAGSEAPLVLQLDGFEGPLDLLLDLARSQKVDLAGISILALVEQYLAVIEGARRVRLELAADWLVMAAWLTWLKSRLLLPPDDAGIEEGEEAAEVLAARILALQAVRAAAAWLAARPNLGVDVFARGAPEDFARTDRSRLAADLPGLMRAYMNSRRRSAGATPYRPAGAAFWTVKDALARLASMLGGLPDWSALEAFLPRTMSDPAERRAALASTLLAGLELARDGQVRLRQEAPFGPILVRGGAAIGRGG